MKFMNKKGWLLRDFIIVGIIFGLTIAMYVVFVAGVSQNYGNTEMISPSFAAHYSTLQTNLQQLDVANKAVNGNGGGLNLIGSFNVAFNSVFTVIAMIGEGVLAYTGMATNIGADFPFLDSSTVLKFIGGVIAIITATIMLIWLSSVMRGKI